MVPRRLSQPASPRSIGPVDVADAPSGLFRFENESQSRRRLSGCTRPLHLLWRWRSREGQRCSKYMRETEGGGGVVVLVVAALRAPVRLRRGKPGTFRNGVLGAAKGRILMYVRTRVQRGNHSTIKGIADGRRPSESGSAAVLGPVGRERIVYLVALSPFFFSLSLPPHLSCLEKEVALFDCGFGQALRKWRLLGWETPPSWCWWWSAS